MDPLKMYFLLKLGNSIAMLVYQRVFSTASTRTCTLCCFTMMSLHMVHPDFKVFVSSNKEQEIVMQRGTLSSKVSICFLCIFTLAIYRTPGWTCPFQGKTGCKTTEKAPTKTAAGSFSGKISDAQEPSTVVKVTWNVDSLPKLSKMSLSQPRIIGWKPFPFQRGVRYWESKKVGI